MPNPPSPGSRRAALEPIRRGFAVVIFAIVVLTYVNAMRRGLWPPGHPFSGITLLSLAASQLVPLGRWRLSLPLAVCGLAAATLWLVTAKDARGPALRGERPALERVR